MKVVTTLTIDALVWDMFKKKFPQKASSLVENYMRQSIELAEENAEAKLAQEQEKLQNIIIQSNLKLNQIKIKQDEISKIKLENAERQLREQKESAKNEKDAIISLKDYGWDIEYQVAKSKNPTITADDFLKSKMEVSQ